MCVIIHICILSYIYMKKINSLKYGSEYIVKSQY